jgi:hypothetical protein
MKKAILLLNYIVEGSVCVHYVGGFDIWEAAKVLGFKESQLLLGDTTNSANSYWVTLTLDT